MNEISFSNKIVNLLKDGFNLSIIIKKTSESSPYPTVIINGVKGMIGYNFAKDCIRIVLISDEKEIHEKYIDIDRIKNSIAYEKIDNALKEIYLSKFNIILQLTKEDFL